MSNLEEKAFDVSLHKNPKITMNVIPGHFTTSRAHISHYLDVSTLKSDALVARDVARELAIPYLSTTLIETIVCMERTEVIGAYLAEELLQAGGGIMNEGSDIFVVTPISNNIGNFSFQSSMIKKVRDKHTLLITATISSGRTLDAALDCLSYYGARVVGISALFTLPSKIDEYDIHTLFSKDDIPGYALFGSRDCDMCRDGLPLDALISSEGYALGYRAGPSR